MEFIRQKRQAPNIDMTPMIDIVFQLLIFFMISSNFISPSLKMELPKAMFKEKLEKVDTIITMSAQGDIYLNREKVEPADLKTRLAERMNSIGKYDVIFKGDTAINYGVFVDILDTSKLAGATSFSIEHAKGSE